MNYIVANNIRSAYNIGSLFRLADSLNMSLILQGISPYPRITNDTRPEYAIEKQENKIKKSAVRTFSYVDYKYFKTTKQTLNFLKKSDICIYSLENDLRAGIDLFSLTNNSIKSPYALVLGNEVEGVSKEFLERSEKILYIPMYGKNNSLNVSVSAGIALYILYTLKSHT